MNPKVFVRDVTGFLSPQGRKGPVPSGGVLVKWPAMDGWLAVADEAVRSGYAARCAALALEQHPEYEDISRFLKRRAEMLLGLVETLSSESRSEERIKAMDVRDVLNGIRQAEEKLSAKVRTLLTAKGLSHGLSKLLEREYFFSQTSQAQIKLAQFEKE